MLAVAATYRVEVEYSICADADTIPRCFAFSKK